MLRLKKIVKNYVAGETTVQALKGVDMSFRANEFVSILGPSGCGKTTLLNIIGGLDRYTSGDLEIDGVSTVYYGDSDWDTYRNHTIGFIFQTYNLIPHQTVLGNVELALTLSGVSKAIRREKAKEALIKVGLKDQINKMPNQLSGGQMQRVAIARAIVNDPKIILADEPTGALDSETSIQVMDILKEIAKDRLVIMVTHNAQLAKTYSTRIINLLDGEMIGDTDPYTSEEKAVVAPQSKKEKNKNKKPSMSFFTALSLSLKNLFTKKTRTFMTAFAGSIGIIGIALILSLSSGFNNYISDIERDTLSTYPVTINTNEVDMASFLSGRGPSDDNEHGTDAIYANNILIDMLSSFTSGIRVNDLEKFKNYLDTDEEIKEYTTAITYGYNADINIYKSDYIVSDKITQLIPFNLPIPGMPSTNQLAVWEQMIDNQKLLETQYQFVTTNSKWPSSKNEVILVVNNEQELYDYTLYALGLRDSNEIYQLMNGMRDDPDFKLDTKNEFSYDEIVGLSYKLVVSSDYYQFDATENVYKNMSTDKEYMKSVLENALNIKIVGIVKPKEGVQATSISGAIGYTKALTEYIIERNNSSAVLTAQLANKTTSVLTNETINEGEYNDLLLDFGYADLKSPSSINIYPASFEAKEKIIELIGSYNASVPEEDKIHYTDYIGIMMSSISTIINAITYVLIAFVAISLVVSSIMIGIITYISVLERIKEIGVLRSIGASKRDISRVFNAETLIIGFTSGTIGILFAALMTIPINLIINLLADIGNVAKLPVVGAVILIVISMLLTFIAGLVPSRIAAKKDPVIALRSE